MKQERLSVAVDVGSLRPNEADKIMYCARFVIWDLHQDWRDGLPKSCQVGIGRLSGDRLEVIESVREFRHDIFWSHAAPSKVAGLSSLGYGGAGVNSLGKHRE